VKVIDLKMLKCEINRTLLSSEIEILKTLRNVPHILSLHEVYTTKNNTYIITELCDTDLSHKIKKKLTEPEVFYYMAQFLSGYSYVYEK
jgi:serine/threonine protein kinase